MNVTEECGRFAKIELIQVDIGLVWRCNYQANKAIVRYQQKTFNLKFSLFYNFSVINCPKSALIYFEKGGGIGRVSPGPGY